MINCNEVKIQEDMAIAYPSYYPREVGYFLGVYIKKSIQPS